MKIAVDFDNVLYDYDGKWRGGELPLPPVSGAPEAMRLLASEHELIVFSTRGWLKKHRDRMAVWLEAHAIPFDEIARTKPNADLYIDDKALRFRNWNQVLNQLTMPRMEICCELAVFHLGQADNAGRILRNADAFGCRRVHFVACMPDIRGMIGNAEGVHWPDPEAFWDKMDLPALALHPRPSLPALIQLPPACLLVLGGESQGLSPAELERCLWRYRIPAAGAYSCLMADTAAAIALHMWHTQWGGADA